jgi:glycosyltransferase involved in cell wall biosynthesis
VVEAAMMNESASFVILGQSDAKSVQFYRNQFGNVFDEKFYFVGFVPQMDLVNYLDHALASIILYRNESYNQWFCEPNRLYQAVCRGIPVIVGNNPPMKQIVSRIKNGIVLSDDGGNGAELCTSLNLLITNQDEFKKNAAKHLDLYNWSQQENKILQYVK